MLFLNSASSAAALVFYLPGVCTHTDTEGKQSSEYFEKFGKNTIFNEHPVPYICSKENISFLYRLNTLRNNCEEERNGLTDIVFQNINFQYSECYPVILFCRIRIVQLEGIVINSKPGKEISNVEQRFYRQVQNIRQCDPWCRCDGVNIRGE